MISRAMIAQLGRIGEALGGDQGQWIVYLHKAAPELAAVRMRLQVRLAAYSQRELSASLMILPTDEKGFVRSAALSFVPTVDDVLVAPDGTRRLVMSFTGLVAMPFTVFQLRKTS